MDFNATIDLIIKDLDEVRIIIDDLKYYPGVPSLQIELAKSKCKSAGEVIALLKSEKDVAPALSITPALQVTSPPVVTSQIVISEEVDSPVVDSHVVVSEDIYPDVVSNHVDKSQKIQKKAMESTIIADKFSHQSSINEQLGGQKGDDDVSDFLKTQPLASLSEAIGVNDRFLFIREIFNGNKEEYATAISQLNNARSLSDARVVITSYTGEKNENEAVKQLLNLVKRKLPSDE
jgi:hypothetical protein